MDNNGALKNELFRMFWFIALIKETLQHALCVGISYMLITASEGFTWNQSPGAEMNHNLGQVVLKFITNCN